MVQLKKAQEKYKKFDKAAEVEFERLQTIDQRKKLNSTNNAAEHAIFCHLCTLKEGLLFP